MSQMPSRANQQNPPSMSAVGTSMESSTDKLIQEGRAKTLSNNIKSYPEVVENTARSMVNEAAGQTGREVITGMGGSSETADQVVSVAQNGSNATDSILNLAAGGVDSVFGTNIGGFVDDVLPQFRPDSTEPPPGGVGVASPNSPIGRIRRREEPLFSYKWSISLPKLEGLEHLKMSIFNDYVEEASISLPYFHSEPVFRNGSYIYYPMFSDVGSLSLIFYEDAYMNVTQYEEAWKNLIQDKKTRFYNRPSVYKKDIHLTPLDSMGLPVGTYTIKGAFPNNGGQVNFQSANSEPVKRTLEFSMNRIVFHPWEGREAEIANMRAGLPNTNSVSSKIRQGNLSDVAENPMEFIKQSAGLSPNSDFKIRF